MLAIQVIPKIKRGAARTLKQGGVGDNYSIGFRYHLTLEVNQPSIDVTRMSHSSKGSSVTILTG